MVDFDSGREERVREHLLTGGPAAGGLTVRDVFACTAMGAYLEASMGQMIDCRNIAENAYMMADAMLEARITLPPEQDDVTVEEAFGLGK